MSSPLTRLAVLAARVTALDPALGGDLLAAVEEAMAEADAARAEHVAVLARLPEAEAEAECRSAADFWLRDRFDEQPQWDTRDLRALAEQATADGQAGLNERTLRRAARRLGVRSKSTGYGAERVTVWTLGRDADDKDDQSGQSADASRTHAGQGGHIADTSGHAGHIADASRTHGGHKGISPSPLRLPSTPLPKTASAGAVGVAVQSSTTTLSGQCSTSLSTVVHSSSIAATQKPSRALKAQTQMEMLPVVREAFDVAVVAAEAQLREAMTAQAQLDAVLAAKVKAVFACWRQVLGSPRARLDEKRATRIMARLRENDGDVHELCWALEGAAKDDWITGRDGRSPGYRGLETVLRDRAQVERFAATMRGYRDGQPHPFVATVMAALLPPADAPPSREVAPESTIPPSDDPELGSEGDRPSNGLRLVRSQERIA